MATVTNRSRPTPSDLGRRRTYRAILLYGLAAALLLAMVWAAAGPVGATPPLVLAAFGVALIALGPERLGLGLLLVAFFTAPFYKGLALIGPAITLTDVSLVLGFALLLPRLLDGRLRISPLWLGGTSTVLFLGAVASLMSDRPMESFTTLVQWGLCILLLPIAMVALRPSPRLIDRFAWFYVLGHVFDTVYAVTTQNPADGRYLGLTPHPNYFAEAGMMSVALLLHLSGRTRHRLLWWACVGTALLSVYLSGGRAATLVIVGLLLLVPVVERTALAGYMWAFGLAVAAISAQFLVRVSDSSSSIGRLAGGSGADAATQEREEGLRAGLERFWDSPLLGSGLIDLAEVHNNFVEVAIATGIGGVIAYLVTLVALARPLFGRSEMRRLCYTVVAYAAFGLTTPSLTDRTIWLAVALSFAVFAGHATEPREKPDQVPPHRRRPAHPLEETP